MNKTGIYHFGTELLTQLRQQNQEQEIVPVEKTAVITKPHRQSIIIDATPKHTATATLSHYLREGAKKHPICRNSFVQKVTTGFYHYEREVHFHTCAVAAAYVGAFGSEIVEDPHFSYSMATWKLGHKLGYNLQSTFVTGPTGRQNSIAREMMSLVDTNWWTREGVADWLEAMGY